MNFLNADREMQILAAGVLAVLIVASIVGFILHLQVKCEKGRDVISNLNARIKTWWVMTVIFFLALATGGVGSVILFGLISFLALREYITLTPTHRADLRDERWILWSTLYTPLAKTATPSRATKSVQMDPSGPSRVRLSRRRLGPYALQVDSSAKRVHVAKSRDNSVSGYQILASGALAPIPNSPFAAGNGPTSIVVDSVGNFLDVANEADNTVSGFKIDSNGALKPVPGSPFAVPAAAGKYPWSVAIF